MSTRPLIPRRKLFDNPTAIGARISPDSRWLTWLAPFEGVMNVWIAPADAFGQGEPLTRTKGRPINWHSWSADSRFVLFPKDETGDEKTHIYSVKAETRDLVDLTPFAGVTALVSMVSPKVPGRIAVVLNDRDARWHDVWAIDLDTHQRSLIWENTQELVKVDLDWSMTPRFARSTAKDGGAKMWRVEGAELSPWMSIAYEDARSTRLQAFDGEDKRLLMMSSIGRNTSALVWHDWESGKDTVIAEHPRYDVFGYISHPITREIGAAKVILPRESWIMVSPEYRPSLEMIRERQPDAVMHVVSQAHDDRRWVVATGRPEQPTTYFMHDRDTGAFTELFSSRPELESYRLAPMQVIEQKSRDGLDLVSYLTLPADITTPRPEKPLPMVLAVHGGPWSCDSHGYSADHQWLADRGYAVLSVNYRGSNGFGKGFIAASEKQHAAKMHDDLIDMVEWAIGEGIADKDKVAITGGSYGGYASFVGATFTPNVFCCSVPVVGITNLETLLSSMPPYWESWREFMYRSYGDPRTEDGRKLLAERSPINKVDAIKKPMLIFHGANDVRCTLAEANQIVEAMTGKGIPVSYVVYPDEGHGFQKPENRLSHVAIAEAFFARHLGGALEPMGEDLEGSSHEIRAGGEDVAALVK